MRNQSWDFKTGQLVKDEELSTVGGEVMVTDHLTNTTREATEEEAERFNRANKKRRDLEKEIDDLEARIAALESA